MPYTSAINALWCVKKSAVMSHVKYTERSTHGAVGWAAAEKMPPSSRNSIMEAELGDRAAPTWQAYRSE